MKDIPPDQLSPEELAKQAQELSDRCWKIYNEKYRAEFEDSHWGMYAAINVDTGEAEFGGTLEEVMAKVGDVPEKQTVQVLKIGAPKSAKRKGHLRLLGK